MTTPSWLTHRGLLLGDAVHGETALDVVNEAEVLTSLLDGDHICSQDEEHQWDFHRNFLVTYVVSGLTPVVLQSTTYTKRKHKGLYDQLGVKCSREQDTWFRSFSIAVGEHDRKGHHCHVFNTAKKVVRETRQ